jgi:uncharacterized membrane protein YcaP (DUF421 family)
MEMFQLTVAPWELVLRGTATYWFLFLIFRFLLKRDVGSLGIADVLVLVLIADASQNAMSGGYESLTDGAILVGTIIGWNYALDWAAFRWPLVRRFAEQPPLALVVNGRVLRRNLAKELLTLDDLKASLREHGVDDVSQVKKAFMEGDGTITVIRNDGNPDDGGGPAGRKAAVPRPD